MVSEEGREGENEREVEKRRVPYAYHHMLTPSSLSLLLSLPPPLPPSSSLSLLPSLLLLSLPPLSPSSHYTTSSLNLPFWTREGGHLRRQEIQARICKGKRLPCEDVVCWCMSHSLYILFPSPTPESHFVSFPDPPRNTERGSGVLSDISWHMGRGCMA